jgi:hypothetical protein
MRILTLDLETYSGVDLTKVGSMPTLTHRVLKYYCWLMPLMMTR